MQEENLEVAEKSLETNKKDLTLMKDYATTTEVNPTEQSCSELPITYMSA